jgi:hypothetical protein
MGKKMGICSKCRCAIRQGLTTCETCGGACDPSSSGAAPALESDVLEKLQAIRLVKDDVSLWFWRAMRIGFLAGFFGPLATILFWLARARNPAVEMDLLFPWEGLESWIKYLAIGCIYSVTCGLALSMVFGISAGLLLGIARPIVIAFFYNGEPFEGECGPMTIPSPDPSQERR